MEVEGYLRFCLQEVWKHGKKREKETFKIPSHGVDSHLRDRLNATRGCETAVTARTRIK